MSLITDKLYAKEALSKVCENEIYSSYSREDQFNIIAGANDPDTDEPYTETDKATLLSFINTRRTFVKTKKAEIDAATTDEELAAVIKTIYTYPSTFELNLP